MKNLFNSLSATSEMEAKFIFQETGSENVEGGTNEKSEAEQEEDDIAKDIGGESLTEDSDNSYKTELGSTVITNEDGSESIFAADGTPMIPTNAQIDAAADVYMDGNMSRNGKTKTDVKRWMKSNPGQVFNKVGVNY